MPGLPLLDFEAARYCEKAVPGRGMLCAEGGRIPDPTLAEKDVVEVCRELEEAVRDETEDEKEFVLGGPAMAVAFTAELTGLELGGAAGTLLYSTARSACVFLCFGADSGTVDDELLAGKQKWDAHDGIWCFRGFEGGGAIEMPLRAF